MKENRFLDVTKVCKHTNFSKSTIYKRVMNNEIPFIKVRGKLIFDRVQIDEWMLNGGQNDFDIPDVPLN